MGNYTGRIFFKFSFVLFHLLQLHSLPLDEKALLSIAAWVQNPWELSGFFEGDIIAPTKKFGGRNVISDPNNYWPNGEIPYQISKGYSKILQGIIRSCLRYIMSETCIKFRPRKPEDTYGIIFSEHPGHGCSSKIGFYNDTTIIHLDPGQNCVQNGVVVHEVLHALGLWHQQSAKDRDNYIDILWDNVLDGTENNFAKAAVNTTNFGFTYDYSSIMHYGEYAFTKNGKKTMLPKIRGIKLGQREHLSEIDVLKLKKMYNCTT